MFLLQFEKNLNFNRLIMKIINQILNTIHLLILIKIQKNLFVNVEFIC